MSDDSLFDRVRSRVASLAPSQDGTADPQARDEDPTTVGREEYREEVDAEQVEKFVEEYYRNPLVRVPIQNFAADVAEPGLSAVVETQEDAEVPTVPDDAPDRYAGETLDTALERWLSQAYIDGFSFDVSAEKLVEEIVKDRRGRRGTAVVEHAWDDPRERERLLALRTVKTETLTAYTREGKGIVLRPDDDPGSFDTIAINDLGDYTREKAPTTPAGHTAAVAQFDEVFGSDDREEVPFALDDLSISPHDADTGALFGRPDSATVINRARALRRKLRHVDQSVINTAFGNVIATVESNNEEIVRNVKDNLDVNVPDRGEAGEVDPDSVSVTNAPVSDLHEVDGGVPDVTDIIQQEIEFILSALPTPLYRVGFAGDINRDVTSEQGEDYRDAVKRERRRIESDLQQPLIQKTREWMHGDATGDESLTVTPHLRIRPSQAESPLRDEEFDAAEFSELMSGLSTAAGPKGGATAIIPQEEIIETMLDMDPDEVLSGQGEDDDLALPHEASEEVREAFEEFTDAELAVDESNPAVANQFGALSGNDFQPELHPRDSEGKFTETPGGGLPDIDFSDFGSEQDRQNVSETFNEWAAWPLAEDTTPAWDAAVNGESTEGWEIARDRANLPDNPGFGSFLGDPQPEKQASLAKHSEWLTEQLREQHGDTITAHRILHEEAAQRVQGRAGLEPRALASWTTSIDTMDEIVAQTGADTDVDLSESVIVTKEIPVENVFGIHTANNNLDARQQDELIASLPRDENLGDGEITQASEVLGDAE
jgi:hypothetical protein